MKYITPIMLAGCASLSRIWPNCSFLYFISIIGLSFEYQYVQCKTRLMALFFFFFTLFTLHWIYIPFTFDEQVRGFAVPAVFVLPTYISLYYWGLERFLGKLSGCCLPTDIVRKVSPILSVRRWKVISSIRSKYICSAGSMHLCIRLVLVIYFSEICCSHLFTGFPWMNSGYAWATDVAILQIASVIGINGLGTFMNLCASVLGLALYEYTKEQRCDFRKLMFSGLIVAAIMMFGECRLSANKTEYTDTTIRLVQASITQDIKNSAKNYDDILQTNIDLSVRKPYVDLIIWPEACIPWLYTRNSSPIINGYLERVTHNCKYLISGIVVKNSIGEYYNSMVAFFNNDKKSLSKILYSKTHLLPFGEYMPLRRFIKAKSIASIISDFHFGTGRSETLDDIPAFQACICYESIFENEFTRKKDSHWILNITNDGWYKTSNENFQHNNISRVLSVEYGLPMVRVNNLGISSVFDAYGRCVKTIPSGQIETIDVKLPKCIKPTLYNKNKGFIYIFLGILLYFIYIKRIFYCIY